MYSIWFIGLVGREGKKGGRERRREGLREVGRGKEERETLREGEKEEEEEEEDYKGVHYLK